MSADKCVTHGAMTFWILVVRFYHWAIETDST